MSDRTNHERDLIRRERLDHLIEDLMTINEDLGEFFPSEFDRSSIRIARVIDTLKDARMEDR